VNHFVFQYCPQCRAELAIRRLGGLDRKACPSASCDFVHWGNPTPVVAGIVERDDRVVLVQSHGGPEGWYGLVTGFLEPGEKPEDAIVREVKEEIGINASLTSYLGAYPFEQINQIIFAYHLVGEAGPITLCEHELADHREVAIEKLRPWSRGTGPAVRDWLASRGLHPPAIEKTPPKD